MQQADGLRGQRRDARLRGGHAEEPRVCQLVVLGVGPDRTRVYQEGIDIPPEVNRLVLQQLAKAGYRLYQQIFYGPAADAQANLLGDRLRQMARLMYRRVPVGVTLVRTDGSAGAQAAVQKALADMGMPVVEAEAETQHALLAPVEAVEHVVDLLAAHPVGEFGTQPAVRADRRALPCGQSRSSP
mgnify:CR=1 FL=1